MKRKKYHLDGIAKITERRKRAAELIEQITRLLREGWSPWVGENDSKNYIPIEIAIEKYRKYLEKYRNTPHKRATPLSLTNWKST